jgi:hypothetical protein
LKAHAAIHVHCLPRGLYHDRHEAWRGLPDRPVPEANTSTASWLVILRGTAESTH